MSLKTADQFRAARAALGWTQADVAKATGISLPSVKRIEGMDGPLSIRLDTLNAIERAFKAAGITFLEDGDVAVGGGVSLRKSE